VLEKELKEIIFEISRSVINGYSIDRVFSEYQAKGSSVIRDMDF